jgi:hypothetical protein
MSDLSSKSISTLYNELALLRGRIPRLQRLIRETPRTMVDDAWRYRGFNNSSSDESLGEYENPVYKAHTDDLKKALQQKQEIQKEIDRREKDVVHPTGRKQQKKRTHRRKHSKKSRRTRRHK